MIYESFSTDERWYSANLAGVGVEDLDESEGRSSGQTADKEGRRSAVKVSAVASRSASARCQLGGSNDTGKAPFRLT